MYIYIHIYIYIVNYIDLTLVFIGFINQLIVWEGLTFLMVLDDWLVVKIRFFSHKKVVP